MGIFRGPSIPYTLALKAASIAVVLDHHAHPYLDTISDICGKGRLWKAKMMRKGPDDAPGIVWALGECFLISFMFS